MSENNVNVPPEPVEPIPVTPTGMVTTSGIVTTPKRAAIYVFAWDQKRRETMLDELKIYAKDRGYAIARIYIDSTKACPKLRRILADAKKGSFELADAGNKVSTIERALAAICAAHTRAGHASPWKLPLVADMRAALRREIGVRAKKRAADDEFCVASSR